MCTLNIVYTCYVFGLVVVIFEHQTAELRFSQCSDKQDILTIFSWSLGLTRMLLLGGGGAYVGAYFPSTF